MPKLSRECSPKRIRSDFKNTYKIQLQNPMLEFDQRLCNGDMRKWYDPKLRCDASAVGIADIAAPSIHTSPLLPPAPLPNCILSLGNLKSESGFQNVSTFPDHWLDSHPSLSSARLKRAECTINLRNNPNSAVTIDLTTSLNQTASLWPVSKGSISVR